MVRHNALRRLGLFLPLRLATYVVLIAAVIIWSQRADYLQPQLIVYSILTLGFAIFISLEKRFRVGPWITALIALQFLAEIVIESGVILATGNVNSPFSALFVLTIVSAALVFRMVGTLLIASIVSGSFAFVIWLGLSRPTDGGVTVQSLETIILSHETAFYAIFLHILIFYLVAFMSGYLAERLASQQQHLLDASRALRQARLETDDILRHLNSGLLTVDAQGQIIYFNRSAERILGYREEQVKGLMYHETFAERMPKLAACLEEGLTNGTVYPRKEVAVIGPNQKSLPLGLSTSMLTEDAGEPRGVIAIFSDLTQAKAMEAKVRTNDRLAAIGELSASMAHEIRNPLAAISGSVEVLQRELTLEGTNARLMELILKESHRLNTTLTDFLLYAREARPTYSKVELCHLVSEVTEMLRMHEEVNKCIDIQFTSDEAIVYVIGDEDMIKQVLVNLGMNACQAIGDQKGRVRFSITIDSAMERVMLSVSDDGPGIDQSIVDRIYQPFFSTRRGGTGLGLAIVHRICSALNLRLLLDTQQERGANFGIEFQEYTQSGSAGIPIAERATTVGSV